jgi:TPR repeat protein
MHNSSADDPLRHGHALLIGNSHYSGWPPLEDVPLQLKQLKEGLEHHFDTVEMVHDLKTDELRDTINRFILVNGNEASARLLIYYAGHGYTEIIRNENRGHITGVDTPYVDGSPQAYRLARLKSITMGEIKAPLERSPANSILFIFDSCFAGTIFTNRAGNDPPRPLTKDIVTQLMQRPAREFITAGSSNQRVPAHSPIPGFFLAALNGAADPYKWGVISSTEIHKYLFDRVLDIRDINLTPQVGKLPNPDFAEGAFLFRVLDSTMRTPDEDVSTRLYREKADKGDASAQVDLAWLYQNGLGGLSKDDREAARLLKLAADQGDARGQYNLGLFNLQGRGGLPKDDGEAARLFKLAADQGNAAAQATLALFYSQGLGGLSKDDREAVRLFKLAADQGNTRGQNNLGLFYEQGRGGLPKDDREAARLYKLAADQGDPRAQNNLGVFYEQGRGGLSKDDREAAHLFKLAADQGDATAQNTLGVFYQHGRGGLPKDDREAARLFQLAADQGDPRAQNNLGVFYQHGRGGLSKDDREAARLFKLAADQGDATAQNTLGVFYQHGRGGLPKDDREAARLFKLAADQGDATAQNNLGLFYEQGRGGLPKDDREAARLFKLAADQGDARAQKNLGLFYEREAARLFKLAADQGTAATVETPRTFLDRLSKYSTAVLSINGAVCAATGFAALYVLAVVMRTGAWHWPEVGAVWTMVVACAVYGAVGGVLRKRFSILAAAAIPLLVPFIGGWVGIVTFAPDSADLDQLINSIVVVSVASLSAAVGVCLSFVFIKFGMVGRTTGEAMHRIDP